MSEFKCEIGKVCKAALLNISPKSSNADKNLENNKKDTMLMLEFYSDFAGTWFDPTEIVEFSDIVIDIQKTPEVSNWPLLTQELPNILSEKMMFPVPMFDYLSKEVSLGDLKEALQQAIEENNVQASGKLQHVYERLEEALTEKGFSKETMLQFDHYALVRFDTNFADNSKYIDPLNQAVGKALSKARNVISDQFERDLETEHRQKICSTHRQPIILQRRPKI